MCERELPCSFHILNLWYEIFTLLKPISVSLSMEVGPGFEAEKIKGKLCDWICESQRSFTFIWVLKEIYIQYCILVKVTVWVSILSKLNFRRREEARIQLSKNLFFWTCPFKIFRKWNMSSTCICCCKGVFPISYLEKNIRFKTGTNTQIVNLNWILRLLFDFKATLSWARNSLLWKVLLGFKLCFFSN